MIVLLALAAVAHIPTAKEQAAIKHVVGDTLKDADSAKYKWQPVKAGTIYCGEVNAKNSYGGYTGYSEFLVMPKSKSLSDLLPMALVGGDDTGTTVTVGKQCRDAGFFSDKP